MAKVAVYVLVAVVLCQSVCVFARQVNLDDYDFDQFINGNNNNLAQPTQAPSGTTTTTDVPQFITCLSNCQSTLQYSPVCGTDLVSYHNIYRLRCAQKCGLRVELSHVGTCGPSAGGK